MTAKERGTITATAVQIETVVEIRYDDTVLNTVTVVVSQYDTDDEVRDAIMQFAEQKVLRYFPAITAQPGEDPRIDDIQRKKFDRQGLATRERLVVSETREGT